ncbi:MAG TPA: TfpX/TfpZ family type IV pilin accessory protein [Usitatibacter sp.]|jgi:hypothetical protein|nr:TfpX/TfpZ family type IV pilin accessory protein [Usitatibacter sp.]
MNRFKAAGIHLGISATIALLVFATVHFLWYPGDLFAAAGGRDLFLIVLAVDVTIGPMVTLIIFVPGKKGLAFDLWVIGILQASFLAYGVFTLAESRPVYIAFVKDRFELVRANEIPDSVLEQARMHRYRDLPWTGFQLVGVRFPDDPDERFKVMVSGMAGVDIQAYPNYHVPYDSVRSQTLAKAAPLANLARFNKGFSVAELAASLGRTEAGLRFLPLRAGKTDLAVIVDAKTADIVKIAALKPWEYE